MIVSTVSLPESSFTELNSIETRQFFTAIWRNGPVLTPHIMMVIQRLGDYLVVDYGPSTSRSFEASTYPRIFIAKEDATFESVAYLDAFIDFKPRKS